MNHWYPTLREINYDQPWQQNNPFVYCNYGYYKSRRFQRKNHNKTWIKNKNLHRVNRDFKNDMKQLTLLQSQWKPIEKYIEKPKLAFNSDDNQIITFRPHKFLKKSVIDLKFLKECLDAIDVEASIQINSNSHQTYKISDISQLNTDFDFTSLIHSISHKYVTSHIGQIKNPFLILQYELRKYQQKEKINEKLLFHGTKYSCMREICNENFNWRLFGCATGHKFGQGVSFTPDFYYASHYGHKSYENVMILAKVLVNEHSRGNQSTVVPPDKCDTTTNDACSVYVKYDDGTFLPLYTIEYQPIFPFTF